MALPSSTDDRYRAQPSRPCGTGVLVLAGSSGRVEQERADLLAQYGAEALSIRWFGGPGQRPAPHEVPLETFFSALDTLESNCEHLAILGTSFGAEAALLTASCQDRVGAVVALAPTAVVWGSFAEDRWASHWTVRGRPVPYVPFDAEWSPSEVPPSYRGLYERSLALDVEVTAAAVVPVENIRGEVVLVAGEDDQVWPSVDFARKIAQRRRHHHLPTRVVVSADAGHQITLPGEAPRAGGVAMVRGGTLQADAELGRDAWPHIATALRLGAGLDPQR